MTVLLGARRFRRAEGRRGHRNGFYEQDLATQIGIVTAIRVPRGRAAVPERSVFSRHQRRQGWVNQVIRETFLAGVSTRRVVGQLHERFPQAAALRVEAGPDILAFAAFPVAHWR
jgi:transposase-like protein